LSLGFFRLANYFPAGAAFQPVPAQAEACGYILQKLY